jgi:hypothetical protein
MTETDDDGVFVETQTEYEADALDCDHPIELHVGRIRQQRATQICQNLSQFVETHSRAPCEIAIKQLGEAVSDPDEFAAEVGDPGEERPNDCYYPIILTIEDISFRDANHLVGRLNQLAYEGFRGPLVSDFYRAVVDIIEDRPRSIVRLVKDDGSRREALEWHTDTTIEEA